MSDMPRFFFQPATKRFDPTARLIGHAPSASLQILDQNTSDKPRSLFQPAAKRFDPIGHVPSTSLAFVDIYEPAC
jgi:hypothetical protein